jgi:predicted PurR-regulated permease PerM
MKLAAPDNAEPKTGGKEGVKAPSLPERSQWIAVFFFFCFGWIAYETFLLARPFLPGLLGAVMLGLVFSPLHQRVLARIQNPNRAALLLTVGIILLTVIPMGWIGWMAANEADYLRPALADFIEKYQTPSYLQDFFGPVFRFFEGFHIELKPLILDKAAEISARMGSGGMALAGHILITIFNGIVLMSTLFFVFRDGKKAAEMVLSTIPISSSHKQAIFKSVYGTFRAVVAGVFVNAVTAGLADMLGFFAAGVPVPVFFGLAAAVFSLFGASALITVPVAFWVMNHDTGWGIFLLVWGILVSVLGDNLLKPILIGSKARMPFIVMLFSTLGGIKLYGFMGLFLGPMVVTAFLAFWNIYRRDYKT